MKKKIFYTFLLFWGIASSITAQDVLKVDGLINVAIDCNNGCDYDYLRQEIKFVNHVRVRQTADVFIYSTSISTGAAGEEISLYFIGQNMFNGIEDTLKYNTPANAPFDDVRSLMAKKIAQGLFRYAIHSNSVDFLSINYSKQDNKTPEVVKDPWNYWIFEVNGNAWGYGESNFGGLGMYSSLSASKTTKMNKYRFTMDGSYNSQWFLSSDDNGEDVKERFNQQNYGFELLHAKGINDHWTIGSYANYFSSIFNNLKNSYSVRPTLEYSVFPYSEANSKALTLQYNIGAGYNNYNDTTIYNKINETVLFHSLSLATSLTQKWGSVNTALSASHYLHTPDKYSVTLGGWLNWNVAKGLSLSFGGNAGLIRDRITLVKGDVRSEDLLLRQRQLATGYEYFFSSGINYVFGSNNNNVVNARMRQSRFQFNN